MSFKKRFEGRTSLIGKTGLVKAVLSVQFPIEKDPTSIVYQDKHDHIYRPTVINSEKNVLKLPKSRSNRKYSIGDGKPDFLTPQPGKQIEFPFVSKLAEYHKYNKSSNKKHCMLIKLMEKNHNKGSQSRTIDNAMSPNNKISLPKIKL